MPRPWVLVTVFLVSLLGFGLASIPAELALARVSGMSLAGEPLHVIRSEGRIWQGGAHWRWRERSGRLHWALEWRDWMPGLSLELASGPARLRGWLSGTTTRARALDWQVELPVPIIASRIERGDAGGVITGRIRELDWHERRFRALEGRLRWTDASVSWQGGGGADLPALEGRLFMDKGAARAQVTDPDGRTLADARLADGQLEFRVYRAWPMLLGVSGGGQASDVVLEVSRPLLEQEGEGG